MKAGKPSVTASWVAAWRGLAMHAKPVIARDPVAELVVPSPYAEILASARQVPAGVARFLAFADFVSRGRSQHMALRTRAIDEGVIQAVSTGTRQLVVLGAGLDARAFRLGDLKETRVFEVDHPSTQAYKRERVEGLASVARSVSFVPLDFEEGSRLGEHLKNAGHDPNQKSVFVWEGVTMYLTRSGIDATLQGVRSAAAPGSSLLLTYFERSAQPLGKALSLVLRGISEPLRSAFRPPDMAKLLASHGLVLDRDEGDPEWRPRYLGKPQSWSLERLATALVP